MNSLDCKCKVCGKPISEYDYKYRNRMCIRCQVDETYRQQAAALQNDEETETEYEDDIVCPWCGYRMQDDDAYFVSEQSGEYDCPECGKMFHFDADIEVTYSTRRVSEDK
mgnify:CR=1 FL=1